MLPCGGVGRGSNPAIGREGKRGEEGFLEAGDTVGLGMGHTKRHSKQRETAETEAWGEAPTWLGGQSSQREVT